MEKKKYTLPCTVVFHTNKGNEVHEMHYDEYLQTDWWKKRSERTKSLAGHKCELCGSTAKLSAHHYHYNSLGHEEDKDLLCVCWPCHERIHRLDNREEILEARKVLSEKFNEAQEKITSYYYFVMEQVVEGYGKLLEDAVVQEVYQLAKDYKGKQKPSLIPYLVRQAGEIVLDVYRNSLDIATQIRKSNFEDKINERYNRSEIAARIHRALKLPMDESSKNVRIAFDKNGYPAYRAETTQNMSIVRNAYEIYKRDHREQQSVIKHIDIYNVCRATEGVHVSAFIRGAELHQVEKIPHIVEELRKYISVAFKGEKVTIRVMRDCENMFYQTKDPESDAYKVSDNQEYLEVANKTSQKDVRSNMIVEGSAPENKLSSVARSVINQSYDVFARDKVALVD